MGGVEDIIALDQAPVNWLEPRGKGHHVGCCLSFCQLGGRCGLLGPGSGGFCRWPNLA